MEILCSVVVTGRYNYRYILLAFFVIFKKYIYMTYIYLYIYIEMFSIFFIYNKLIALDMSSTGVLLYVRRSLT